MIIRRAQHRFVDVWDETETGWVGHTRVQLSKKPGFPLRAYYVSGNILPRIKLVEIVKELEAGK